MSFIEDQNITRGRNRMSAFKEKIKTADTEIDQFIEQISRAQRSYEHWKLKQVQSQRWPALHPVDNTNAEK